MILCRKCHIDYDRCDCGTEEKPKKTIGDYITRFIIGVVIVACIVGMFSCNPTKQAARKAGRLEAKAEKHLYKSISLDPMPFTIECAQKFNPIDSINETLIIDTTYLPSEIKYIQLDIDSLLHALGLDQPCNHSGGGSTVLNKFGSIKLPCPPCDSTRIINTYKSRFQAESNKALLAQTVDKYEGLTAQLRDERDEARVSKEKMKERRNMWRIIALGLAAYTLLRWLLRYFTKGVIKLP